MTNDSPAGFGRMFTETAERRGDAVALVCGDERVTFADLERRANRLARELAMRGTGAKDIIAIALPNCPGFFVVALAAWKLGATPFPLNYGLPENERRALIELAEPAVVVGSGGTPLDDLEAAAASRADDALPDVESRPWKAIGTGGSTGRPKLIIDHAGLPAQAPAATAVFGMEEGMAQIIAGPLYHNGPFVWGAMHLLIGGTLVVMPRFDPIQYLELIEEEHVGWSFVVPTMLHRIVRLPAECLARYDISSLRTLLHSAAPCPEWLKRRTIEIFGAERVVEFYGATEVGATIIRGDEWLAHPGSVGRPIPGTTIRILDEYGVEVPAGTVGEIWVKPPLPPTATYRGAELRQSDGFISVGDLGWLDADGYLYIADRRVDLIISGGANVYPAEVEAALIEHPDVADAAVLGLADPEWGQRIHAVVELADGSRVDTASLEAHCRARLAAYKVPRSWEVVAALPRDPSGKIRRSAMREEREAAAGA